MASSTTTINEMGTSREYAAEPTAASEMKTIRISSVAYAVEEIASLANTGRATFFGSRVCPSSEVAMGLPITKRLSQLPPMNRAMATASLPHHRPRGRVPTLSE